MPNNGTIAIWCVPRANSAPTDLEAHFNYWRIAGDPAFLAKARNAVEDFIEIGLLVTDITQIDRIRIYIPTKVHRSSVEDCARFLSQSQFAQGIFNEVFKITAPVAGGTGCIELNDKPHSVFCRVHSFAHGSQGIEVNELEIAEQHDGTVLTILPDAIHEACNHAAPPAPSYFRLRIHLKSGSEENPFVKVIQPHDRRFQSGFDEIEYIDFRMNEARTLPPAIEQRMRNDRAKGGEVAFKLIAFLTAVPVHSELSVSNTPSHKMRLLEQSWNGYVSSGIPDGMVVYHWKRQAPISDFSAFVKLQTRRSSRKILLIYLVIAFIFGLGGNFAASGIQALWDRAWTEMPASDVPSAVASPTADHKLVPALPARPAASDTDKTRRDQSNSVENKP
ncbi:hypothetical protein DM806_26685 [Sphingobium lactosutens]|uniref:hypothetical protein n=1 Tax=Sphingobium lactosutens TaxID=522773 RepID=UPI0015BDAF9B|nr:hypothetical protein [Sphingobium lactosutens]NWK99181.1 hypothetical protein [Sphingobium lactosutens]